MIEMRQDPSIKGYIGKCRYRNTDCFCYAAQDREHPGKWMYHISTLPQHSEDDDWVWIATTQHEERAILVRGGGYESFRETIDAINTLLEKDAKVMAEQKATTTKGKSHDLGNAEQAMIKAIPSSQQQQVIPKSREIDITIPVNASQAIEDAISALEEDKSELEDAIRKLEDMISEADSTISQMHEMISTMAV